MNESKPPAEIWELFDAACDGRLSDAEVERLQSFFESPDLRQLFVDYCRLQTDLHFRIRANQTSQRALNVAMIHGVSTPDRNGSATPEATGEPPVAPTPLILTVPQLNIGEPSGLDEAGNPAHFGWLGDGWRSATFFLLGSIVTFAGVGIWLLAHGDRQEKPLAQRPTARADAEFDRKSQERHGYAAKLISVANCQWDRKLTTADLRPGGSLQPGESLRLLEGIAEISTASTDGDEMRIQLEGPLSMALTNGGMPSLIYGKLSAVFTGRPDQFFTFTIDTPLGRAVVTSDAAFGVMAKGNEVELHVFSGQIAFDSLRPMRGDANVRRWSISAGSSIHLTDQPDGDIAVERGEADESSFATPSAIAARQLLISEEYVREIRSGEPKFYWRFENVADGVVRNEVGDRLHCRVMGDGVRWHLYDGNQSAKFGAASSPGYLFSDDSLQELKAGDYTLEAWIKPHCYHLGVVCTLLDWSPAARRANNSHRVHLELSAPVEQAPHPSAMHPGRVRFMHVKTSCYSQEPYRLFEWQHVAAVKEGGKMRLYVAGKLVADAADENELSGDLRVLIGRQVPYDWSKSRLMRHYIGEIDEVAFYDRALSKEEIRNRTTMVESAAAAQRRRLFDDRE